MIPGGPGQFNFNQYLIEDEKPLLFHAGPRRLFPHVREAVGQGLHWPYFYSRIRL
jgi:preprotein translocase subunit SecB